MLVEAKGLDEVIERMRARSDRIKDLSEAMRSYGEGLVTKTDDGFNGEKNFDGTAFAPLADSTLTARASAHASGKGGYRATRAQLRTKMTAAGKSSAQITKALRKHAAAYQFKRIGFAVGMSAAEKIDALEKLRVAYEKRRAKIQSATGQDSHAALKKAQHSYERKRKAIAAPVAHKILTDTARARNSNHISDVTNDSMRWSAVGYLAYHMSGTHRMPARNPTGFVWDGSKWTLHPKAKETLDKIVTKYVYTGDLQ